MAGVTTRIGYELTEAAEAALRKANPEAAETLSTLVRRMVDPDSGNVKLIPKQGVTDAELQAVMRGMDFGGRPPPEASQVRVPLHEQLSAGELGAINRAETPRAPFTLSVDPDKQLVTTPNFVTQGKPRSEGVDFATQGELDAAARAGAIEPRVTPATYEEPPPSKPLSDLIPRPRSSYAQEVTSSVPPSGLSRALRTGAAVGAVGAAAGVGSDSARTAGESDTSPAADRPSVQPAPTTDREETEEEVDDGEAEAAEAARREAVAARQRQEEEAARRTFKGGVDVSAVYDDASAQAAALKQLSAYDETRPGEPTELTTEERAELDARVERVQTIYAEARQRNAWAEVAEQLGHALVQLGAARHGMRTGTDMSGVKFDRTNWEARNDRAIRELEIDLGIEERRRRERLAELQEARAALAKWQEGRTRLGERQETARQAGLREVGEAVRFNAKERGDWASLWAQLDSAERRDAAKRKEEAKEQEVKLQAQQQERRNKYGTAYSSELDGLLRDQEAILSRVAAAKKPQDAEDPDIKAAAQTWVKMGFSAEDFDQLHRGASEGVYLDSTSRTEWKAGVRRLLDGRLDARAQQLAYQRTGIAPAESGGPASAPAPARAAPAPSLSFEDNKRARAVVDRTLSMYTGTVPPRAEVVELLKRAGKLPAEYRE